ncbi:molybdopterin cofactor-binding domain-containing protein [Nibricoccus sp. IMCC34717]|uniref:xanthine dehydrogenase family protein molybdopterin-binding subunit n=1 Tax=Nibricoccus sp. IMCC34717 TaxID=3034021 RepID=UPI003850F7AD
MSAPLSQPIDRRSFLRLSALASGGLVIGFTLGSKANAGIEIVNTKGADAVVSNAFLRIGSDGSVTLFSHKPEIGQGIRTSLPMVVAEELDVAWESVRVESSPLDEATYGWQGAGGSGATPGNFQTLRQAGASARTLLVQAAAVRWGVPTTECSTAAGRVMHTSGKSFAYAELVADAAKLPAPNAEQVRLKDRSEFRILGKRIGGVDNAKIVRGAPLFGIDQSLPGMVHAVYVKCPVFGGKPTRANLEEVKRLPGVLDAFLVEGTTDLNGLMPGVAIVAKSTWQAFSAQKKLSVTWDEGPAASESWADLLAKAETISQGTPGQVLKQEGDVEKALAAAAKRIEAVYQFPFVSHATLEPQNCLASFDGERMAILAPTQNPGSAVDLVAQVCQLPKDKIDLRMTRIGGGFGRRLMSDFVAEAAIISQRLRRPVKLCWTREDDMQHDMYRPGGYFRFSGGIDGTGRVSAWRCHFVTPGNTADTPGNGAALGGDEFPARLIPNFFSGQTIQKVNVPMGWWRAPGSCTTAWVMQSFVDELAHAAGRDPLAVRLELLEGQADFPGSDWGPGFSPKRATGVLKLVAEKAGWGRLLPRGRGLGLAFHFSHMGYVAQVAEVSVSKEGALRVERVVAAVDVGAEIINLSGAEQQVEGSIVDGLSAAWLQSLTYDKGRMQNTNFHDYRLLRITETPKIETHWLRTDHPVTGLGEPALPPLAPAVCNAIFAATGKRVRTLPLESNDLSWS